MIENLGTLGLIAFFGSLLISVVLHEVMHGYAAYRLGDTTAHDLGRLTLNPLKHIDVVTTLLLPVILIALQLPPFFAAKPVPFNPWNIKYQEFGIAIIGLAGPFTNLVLATIVALAVQLSGLATGTDFYQIFSIFIQVNIALFVFNMIPFPPLDGSRILYAFAPEPLQKIMQQIESLGFTAIFIFIFLLFPFLGPIVIDANQFLYNLLMG